MEAQHLFELQMLSEQPLHSDNIVRVQDATGWFWIMKDGLKTEYSWENFNPRANIFNNAYRAWCNEWAISHDKNTEDKVKEMITYEYEQAKKYAESVEDKSVLEEEQSFISHFQHQLGYLGAKRTYYVLKNMSHVQKKEEVSHEEAS